MKIRFAATAALFVCALLTSFAMPCNAQTRFGEVWVYMYKGHEKYYPKNAPFTDVGYFSAAVTADGNLKGGPTARPTGGQTPRFHLAITAPWNPDLLHLLLSPKLPMRKRLIGAIVTRSVPFDGVQIDFEGIGRGDTANYLSFLQDLRRALPVNKVFSVAVMARWKSWMDRYPNDPYNYGEIGKIADRVIVMAYDEHTGSTKPGPIASMRWCAKILEHAKANIPRGKLVMGIPLYGRTWQSPKLQKSLSNRDAETLRTEKAVKTSEAIDGGSFSYVETVRVTAHYETLTSLRTKVFTYSRNGIAGVAFWRLGHEPKGAWSLVTPAK